MGFFITAKPIFAVDKTEQKNVNLIFIAHLNGCKDKNVTMRLTCSNLYKLYVNDTFVSYGPAKSAKGFYRVDNIKLDGYLSDDENMLRIECTNSFAASFHMLKVGGFLTAEVVSGDRVLLASGVGGDFACYDMSYRPRKAMRVNCQRTFTESYRLFPHYREVLGQELDIVEQGDKQYLPRTIDGADYTIVSARPIDKESYDFSATVSRYIEDYISADPPTIYDCFDESPFICERRQLQQYRRLQTLPTTQSIQKGQALLFDLEKNYSGFIRLYLRAEADTKAAVVFDEILSATGDLIVGRCRSYNYIMLDLKKGEIDFESMEVNTCRYIKLVVLEGSISCSEVSLRQYKKKSARDIQFSCPDTELVQLFDAGMETFRQNAVDLFTDCPGRERGGWLCDSYFTSKVEKLATGKNTIEQAFLSNFLDYRYDQQFVPFGMLPCVYPSENYSEKYPFIPNWAMFFVLEIEESAARNGGDLAWLAKEKIYNLVAYFEAYQNEYGLLENLPGWVFIEWSKANDFTEGVNFPTNMLYCRMLKAVGNLYGDSAVLGKAKRLRDKIIGLSYNGKYFADNAERDSGGRLLTKDNFSEACQYYAIKFLELGGEGTYRAYIEHMVSDFAGENTVDGVHKAAAFIGKYLRLELLCELSSDTVLQELKTLFYPMMRRTSTLWENLNEQGSCCHGFASFVVCAIVWRYCGVRIDTVKKVLSVTKAPMRDFRLSLPVEEGMIQISAKDRSLEIGETLGYEVKYV